MMMRWDDRLADPALLLLAALRLQRKAPEERPPGQFVLRIGDPEPLWRDGDTVIWLPRKAASGEEWVSDCRRRAEELVLPWEEEGPADEHGL